MRERERGIINADGVGGERERRMMIMIRIECGDLKSQQQASAVAVVMPQETQKGDPMTSVHTHRL